MKVIKFKQWECYLYFGQYSHGTRTAIELYELKTDEPIATATVNIPEEYIEDDEVLIKNYSENTGVMEAMIEAGVISEPVGSVPCGMTKAFICQLLIEPINPNR